MADHRRKPTLSADDRPLLEHLSKIHREVLLAEGSYTEIAAALNIPTGTVRSRLNRARKALAGLRADDAALRP